MGQEGDVDGRKRKENVRSVNEIRERESRCCFPHAFPPLAFARRRFEKEKKVYATRPVIPSLRVCEVINKSQERRKPKNVERNPRSVFWGNLKEKKTLQSHLEIFSLSILAKFCACVSPTMRENDDLLRHLKAKKHRSRSKKRKENTKGKVKRKESSAQL